MNSIGRHTFGPRQISATLAMAFVCVAMHSIAKAYPPLSTAGLPALAYNLLSIAFLVLFSASCFALGRLILPKRANLRALDSFLLGSICGFCLFCFLGFALGMSRVLFTPISIAALSLPLLWLPNGGEPGRRMSRQNRLSLLVAAAVMLWIFCFSGVLHFYLENDFSHYYPTLRISVERGDLYPNQSLFAYFFMKGQGATYLMASATSEFAINIVTFYALVGMGLLTYRMVGMVTGNRIAPMAAVLLLLATKLMRIEPYKGHNLVSMLLFSVPYFMTRLQLSPKRARGRMSLLLALLLSATVLATPVTPVFLAVPILLLLVLAWANPALLPLRRAILVAAAPTATFVLVLAINHFTSGIVEVTPLTALARFYDYERISRWFPAAALKIMVVGNEGIDGYVFPARAFLALLGKLALVGALAALLHFRLRAVAPMRLKRIWVVTLPLLALGALCPFLLVSAEQPSLKRLLVFLAPMQIVLVCVALIGALCAAAAWRRADGSRLLPRFALTALFIIAGLYGTIFNWTPKLPHQRAATRAFFGVTSLQPMFGHWRDEWKVAEVVDKMLPQSRCVLTLQFAPYASMYSQRFLRPLEDTHFQELPAMLGTDPDAAAAAYLRADLRHFLVKLPPTDDIYDSLGFAASGALFEPENIGRRFRAVALPDDGWLLVLDGTDADGPPPGEAFFAAYNRRRALDAAMPPNWMIDILLRAKKRHPELVAGTAAP